jgi:glycosyltransferase involved in cell wall biosynthesis
VRVAAVFVLPGRRRAPLAWLNRRIVRWRLGRLMRDLFVEPPVLWLRLPSPEIVDQIGSLSLRNVVYECIDDYSAYPHYRAADRRLLERYERRLATQADLVVTLTQTVAERFPLAARRTHVVPLGADLAHFDTLWAGPPRDLTLLPRPRLGLVGGLDERVDFELLRRLALSDPNWSVVLIGPTLDRAGVDRVSNLPNVHLLGVRPYERVPDYLAGMDVGLIPYRRGQWTDGCFPAKLLEYLASGRPVVATDLPGLAAYATVAQLAPDAPSFVAACQRAAAERDPDAQARRRAVASASSLDARCQLIEDLLCSLPPRRRRA